MLLIQLFLFLPLLLLAAPPETVGIEGPMPPPRPEKSKKNSTMVSEFKEFSEEVASRIDKVVSKRSFTLADDPFSFQGIPLMFQSPMSGFNLGLRLQFQNIKRQDPHEYEIIAQAMSSQRGRQKHQFGFDVPHAFGSSYRLTTRLQYDRDITLGYYGIGNNTYVDPNVSIVDNPLNQNIRESPAFTLQLLKYFNRYFRVGPIIGLKWTTITAPDGSLVKSQQPLGIKGGRTHYVGVGAIYDTLDFEPYPSQGDYHELYLYFHSPVWGSDYAYGRSTYTYRFFKKLAPSLIFAHRTTVEGLFGDVPYYELGAVGGTNTALALGGDRYFRGYEANRFIDKFRFFTSVELRWDPLVFPFSGQEVTIGFVPFFDIGRVWAKFPDEIGTWHPSVGWGARLIWNKRLTVRADVALQQATGPKLVIEIGNSF